MTSRVQVDGLCMGLLPPFSTSNENELILHLLCPFFEKEIFFFSLKKINKQFCLFLFGCAGPLLPWRAVAVCGLLTAVASLVAEHGL